ncbi:hypothetical protein C9374_001281 [Naegleria lovaniensis]|uniref:Uncharacterized protein n=1 Tax=Naegleria lovaniensis TaxID=51637 RepID=A0AA88KS26_NAELO|nr:uncharacterized protein C9374_001281 [Naegleria lovaniensis]KAG2387687.1 hypothetical protein C9374_001281 [Naegleria lovaniensis]
MKPQQALVICPNLKLIHVPMFPNTTKVTYKYYREAFHEIFKLHVKDQLIPEFFERLRNSNEYVMRNERSDLNTLQQQGESHQQQPSSWHDWKFNMEKSSMDEVYIDLTPCFEQLIHQLLMKKISNDSNNNDKKDLLDTSSVSNNNTNNNNTNNNNTNTNNNNNNNNNNIPLDKKTSSSINHLLEKNSNSKMNSFPNLESSITLVQDSILQNMNQIEELKQNTHTVLDIHGTCMDWNFILNHQSQDSTLNHWKLFIASQCALFIRNRIKNDLNYELSCGISLNSKFISKLLCSKYKPFAQCVPLDQNYRDQTMIVYNHDHNNTTNSFMNELFKQTPIEKLSKLLGKNVIEQLKSGSTTMNSSMMIHFPPIHTILDLKQQLETNHHHGTCLYHVLNGVPTSNGSNSNSNSNNNSSLTSNGSNSNNSNSNSSRKSSNNKNTTTTTTTTNITHTLMQLLGINTQTTQTTMKDQMVKDSFQNPPKTISASMSLTPIHISHVHTSIRKVIGYIAMELCERIHEDSLMYQCPVSVSGGSVSGSVRASNNSNKSRISDIDNNNNNNNATSSSSKSSSDDQSTNSRYPTSLTFKYRFENEKEESMTISIPSLFQNTSSNSSTGADSSSNSSTSADSNSSTSCHNSGNHSTVYRIKNDRFCLFSTTNSNASPILSSDQLTDVAIRMLRLSKKLSTFLHAKSLHDVFHKDEDERKLQDAKLQLRWIQLCYGSFEYPKQMTTTPKKSSRSSLWNHHESNTCKNYDEYSFKTTTTKQESDVNKSLTSSSSITSHSHSSTDSLSIDHFNGKVKCIICGKECFPSLIDVHVNSHFEKKQQRPRESLTLFNYFSPPEKKKKK